MNKIEQLIDIVSQERKLYVEELNNITETQANWKSSPENWNLIEITEHLFWAEQGGILGMWKTIEAIRAGQIERIKESVHQDLPIEKIIERTWKTKETVPPSAAPRMGGTLAFWIASLNSLQPILNSFGSYLHEDELKIQSQPHPISGALDFQQRFEFLAFHIARHREQSKKIKNEMSLITLKK